MRTAALAVAAVMAAVTACSGGTGAGTRAGPPTLRPAVQPGELVVDGRSRTYRVYEPTTLERGSPVPLVLVLGGVGNDSEGMVNATQFDREAAAGNFVVAYPEGVDLTWNAGFCCAGGQTSGVDDVAFLSRLIDELLADYDVDPGRVFVTGISAGAMMAYRFACEQPDRIAGVGSVAGSMILERCQPDQGVPAIEIHGTQDPLVPFLGGAVRPEDVADLPAPSAQAVAERWAALNQCPTGPDSQAQGPVTTLRWSACPGGAVELVVVEGGGHTWFAPGFGPANGAVDATKVLWKFFEQSGRKG